MLPRKLRWRPLACSIRKHSWPEDTADAGSCVLAIHKLASYKARTHSIYARSYRPACRQQRVMPFN